MTPGWLQGWSADPVILVGTALAVALFLRGTRSLAADGPNSGVSRRARTGQLQSPEQVSELPGWWAVAAFGGAFVVLDLAACSPIDTYAASLFWVHMIQHLLLFAGYAPLLVLARPWVPLWHGLPGSVQQSTALLWNSVMPRAVRVTVKRLTGPVPAFVLFLAGTWMWHWPPAYDLALSNQTIHDYGEHLSFMVVGVLFWAQVIPSPPFRPRLGYLGRTVYLLAATAQNVALSMILGFAPVALYAPYAALAYRPGGISALADQQIGAAIMWSAGDFPFVIALSAGTYQWLTRLMREGTDDGTAALVG